MPWAYKILRFVIPHILIYFVVRSACQTNLTGVRKKGFQDAFLWPGNEKKGIHLKFSDGPEDWADLWSLMTSQGFLTIGTLCVRGSFIMYEGPLFYTPKPDAFEILAGDYKCTQISENTKSIQAIGSVGSFGAHSVTFFEKPYFGSEAFPTTINVGSDFFRKMEYTRSAILHGTTPWMIELRNGTRFCLLSDFDSTEDYPICNIPDFAQLLDSASENDTDTENIEIIFERATQGCTKDIPEEFIFKIDNCRYWDSCEGGDDKLKPACNMRNKLMLEDTSSSNLAGRSGDIDYCADEQKIKDLLLFYKTLILKDFDSTVIMGVPPVGRHTWKLDLLDYIFTIVENVVEADIISLEFLNKVRELFVRQLVTVWSADGYMDKMALSDDQYSHMMRLSAQCDTASEEAYMDWVPEFRRRINVVTKMSDFNSLIDPAFQRKQDLNFVAETVWTAGHMAGYICHGIYQNKNHYWALFIHAFWNLYIMPVVPEWKKPQEGLYFYLGGINHRTEYQKLAMFATIAKRMANDMEPLQRPTELFQTGLNTAANSTGG